MKYWRLRTTIILCSLVIIAVGFMDFSFTTPDFSVLMPSPSPSRSASPRPKPSALPLTAKMATDVVNRWRLSQNLTPYRESIATCDIATARLPEIQKHFSHEGFLKYPKKYIDGGEISENLAQGFFTKNDVNVLLRMWVSSPTHLENLKKAHTTACIKCGNGYCVQIFANF